MRFPSAGALALAAGVLLIALATPAAAQMIRLDAIPQAFAHRDDEPFGRSTFLAPAGPLWIKWRQFDDGMAKDSDSIARCREDASACSPAAHRLLTLIDEARTLQGRHQLAVVNRAVNLAIAYTSDQRQYGMGDVWSSPLTTFTSARGDCEDYAIAKFFALRAAGVPAENLRLLIAHNRSDGDAHAVLVARDADHWLVLDNRRMMLLDTETVRDLDPLFALDATGVQQYAMPPMPQAPERPLNAPVAAPVSASLGDTLPLLL